MRPQITDTIEHTFSLDLKFEGKKNCYIILAHWHAWFTSIDKTAMPETELSQFWVSNANNQELNFTTLPTETSPSSLVLIIKIRIKSLSLGAKQ